MSKVLIFLILLYCTQILAKTPKNYEAIFRIYYVDNKVKNFKGWQRVCYNDVIEVYSAIYLTDKNILHLCSVINKEYKEKYGELRIHRK